jgi:3-methyladenine DNA glycosylase/8-oxoguanine DNA glycosylase
MSPQSKETLKSSNKSSSKGFDFLARDKNFAPWIKKIGPLKVSPHHDEPFNALCRAIVYQQLSGKAAATIFSRFEGLYGGKFPSPSQVLKTPVAKLRSAGLSGQKSGYLLDLAQKTVDGIIPTLAECKKMSDEELVEHLTQVKGIGLWTAEIFIMFNLGRTDVLPAHDLGLKKGYQIVYKKRAMPTTEQLKKWTEKLSPHRTLAARYLWKIADFAKESSKEKTKENKLVKNNTKKS